MPLFLDKDDEGEKATAKIGSVFGFKKEANHIRSVFLVFFSWFEKETKIQKAYNHMDGPREELEFLAIFSSFPRFLVGASV